MGNVEKLLPFFNYYRFFVLNNEAGLLEYFVNEQSRNQKPRGTLQLAGAVISPSDEDSHTFTVNAASGEQYKLRGMIAGREIKKASYREVNRLIEKKNTIFKVHMMCFMHYIFYFLHALHLIFITNYQILFHFKDKKNKANTN